MYYMMNPCDQSDSFIDPADQVSILKNLVCSSLVHVGYTYSMVVAHRGPDPLFLALLRPYPKGSHIACLEEIISLATPLGADRIAFCSTGKAWSMADPVPPVCDAGDLRQRVIIVSVGDASPEFGKAGINTSYLWPLEECLAGESPSVLDGGIGPLHVLLTEAATAGKAIRDAQPAPWEDNRCLREGAKRLLELEATGHTIMSLGPKLEHTMGVWLDRFCTASTSTGDTTRGDPDGTDPTGPEPHVGDPQPGCIATPYDQSAA